MKTNKFKIRKFLISSIILLFLFNNFYNISTADFEGRPDLVIDYIDFDTNVSEGDSIEFIVKIKNKVNSETGEFGNITAGESIIVVLRIDGIIVSSNSSNKVLNVRDGVFINLSWVANYTGVQKRKISIEVNPDLTISESDINNNFIDGFIYVSEKGSLFEIISVVAPDFFVFNETANIVVNIKNNGASSVKPIFCLFNTSVDGNILTIKKEKIINRYDTFEISFNWTPSSFGVQSFSIDIVYSNRSHDIFSKSTVVGPSVLEWWNSSWHYRYLLTTTGKGIISKSFNFTELLNDLNIESGVFENDKIRIIKYDYNGKVNNIIEDFYFNESDDFDSVLNATGELFWNITDSDVGFYCVYFDVQSNSGIRTSLSEEELFLTGGVDITFPGYVEGWGIDILEPDDDSYLKITDTVDIKIETNAKAENITLFCYSNLNPSHNFKIFLNNVENYEIWVYNGLLFDQGGNWTLEFTGYDIAGFNASIKTIGLYVGQPDLEVRNIDVSTDNTETFQTIYKNDTIYLNTGIFCYNANINNVSVLFLIVDNTENTIYSEILNMNFSRDILTNVSFQWKANVTGEFFLRIFVDYNETVDELDETNNNLSQRVIISDWPDLAVISIDWTDKKIMEDSDVIFDVIIENQGSGNANKYMVKLFIEPESQQKMLYENSVDIINISLQSRTSDTFNLVWEGCEDGNYLVGIKIFINDTKKDGNRYNNHLLSEKILVIHPYESIRPNITNVVVEPEAQKKGGIVKIYADVTDDTGLSYVKIDILNPSGIYFNESMFRISSTRFRYVFIHTENLGIYNFKIYTEDISKNKNNNSFEGSFEITDDLIFPIIDYVGAEPLVQLVDKEVSIICIATDNNGVESVEAIITSPEAIVYEENLLKTTFRYIYKNVYTMTGRYEYYIRVTDDSGNIEVSDKKNFWITKDIDDADNDGMPNWWEEKYGFDPYNEFDALDDIDDDGLINKVEYESGLNPNEDSTIQNIIYRISNNFWYFIASIMLFIFILFVVFKTRIRRL